MESDQEVFNFKIRSPNFIGSYLFFYSSWIFFFPVSKILSRSLPRAISYTRKWSTSVSWETETETTAANVGTKKPFPTISKN